MPKVPGKLRTYPKILGLFKASHPSYTAAFMRGDSLGGTLP